MRTRVCACAHARHPSPCESPYGFCAFYAQDALAEHPAESDGHQRRPRGMLSSSKAKKRDIYQRRHKSTLYKPHTHYSCCSPWILQEGLPENTANSEGQRAHKGSANSARRSLMKRTCLLRRPLLSGSTWVWDTARHPALALRWVAVESSAGSSHCMHVPAPAPTETACCRAWRAGRGLTDNSGSQARPTPRHSALF